MTRASIVLWAPASAEASIQAESKGAGVGPFARPRGSGELGVQVCLLGYLYPKSRGPTSSSQGLDLTYPNCWGREASFREVLFLQLHPGFRLHSVR